MSIVHAMFTIVLSVGVYALFDIFVFVVRSSSRFTDIIAYTVTVDSISNIVFFSNVAVEVIHELSFRTMTYLNVGLQRVITDSDLNN